jgi:hypothetical protein
MHIGGRPGLPAERGPSACRPDAPTIKAITGVRDLRQAAPSAHGALLENTDAWLVGLRCYVRPIHLDRQTSSTQSSCPPTTNVNCSSSKADSPTDPVGAGSPPPAPAPMSAVNQLSTTDSPAGGGPMGTLGCEPLGSPGLS